MAGDYKPIWWRPWMDTPASLPLSPADSPPPADALESDDVQGYMFLPGTMLPTEAAPAPSQALPS